MPENGKDYFTLTKDAVVVSGAKRGALYDLKAGKVFSINEISKKILECCAEGTRISALKEEVEESKEELILGFLEKLVKAEVGKYIADPGEKEVPSLEESTPGLSFIWLELRPDCNLRCVHCYIEGDNTKRAIITIPQWEKAITEAAELGCQRLQYIGGEPLLYGSGFFKLIEIAKDHGFTSQEIFTNATLLDEEKVKKLADAGVSAAVSIYSYRPETHDIITGKKGSFSKALTALEFLIKYEVPTRTSTIIMKQNEDEIEKIKEFLKGLGIENSGFDQVRPVGGGKDQDIQVTLSSLLKKRIEPKFRPVDRQTFLMRKSYNSCWAGKLTITSGGNVIPCIMAREQVAGNILQDSLRTILEEGKMKELWSLSWDQINVCRDCEYRYACKDCRPAVYGTTGDLCHKPIYCTYDPYTGVWGEE